MVSLRSRTIVCSLLSVLAKVVATSENLDIKFLDHFEGWARNHEKLYDTIEKEERFRIWVENHLFILKHNHQKPQPSFLMGHNQFSDLTDEEYQERNRLGSYSRLGSSLENKDGGEEKDVFSSTVSISRRLSLAEEIAEEQNLPDEINWVTYGAVNSVKDQGQCGSCWAFSAIGAIEGAYFLKTGENVDLSEQQLLDCDNLERGCAGGLMDNAFRFDETTNGLCTYDDYPYTARKNKMCQSETCSPVEGTIVESYVDLAPRTEEGLMSFLTKQPVSVGINASPREFRFYKSGVFDAFCPPQVDHGVLAVGYGTETGEDGEDAPYWLIKNSWGEKWGEEGYFKMARSSLSRHGRCGIYNMATYPVLA